VLFKRSFKRSYLHGDITTTKRNLMMKHAFRFKRFQMKLLIKNKYIKMDWPRALARTFANAKYVSNNSRAAARS